MLEEEWEGIGQRCATVIQIPLDVEDGSFGGYVELRFGEKLTLKGREDAVNWVRRVVNRELGRLLAGWGR